MRIGFGYFFFAGVASVRPHDNQEQLQPSVTIQKKSDFTKSDYLSINKKRKASGKTG